MHFHLSFKFLKKDQIKAVAKWEFVTLVVEVLLKLDTFMLMSKIREIKAQTIFLFSNEIGVQSLAFWIPKWF